MDTEMQKVRIMYAELLLRMIESKSIDHELKEDIKPIFAREFTEIEKRMK